LASGATPYHTAHRWANAKHSAGLVCTSQAANASFVAFFGDGAELCSAPSPALKSIVQGDPYIFDESVRL
tara:strand:- start:2151 stop:2360 length:210 start_codon:yes stop_codon:yes gene_type:complete